MRTSRILSPGRSCCAKQARGGQCLPWIKGGCCSTGFHSDRPGEEDECFRMQFRTMRSIQHHARQHVPWKLKDISPPSDRVFGLQKLITVGIQSEQQRRCDIHKTCRSVTPTTALQFQTRSSLPFPNRSIWPETPQKNLTETCLGRLHTEADRHIFISSPSHAWC